MRKATLVLGLFALGLTAAGFATSIATGQPGGGFGRGGGGGNDPLQLLNNASVKKELELSDEQSKQLPDAVMKALSGVLNEKQMTRFRQIELQQRGNNAFTDEKVQEKLKFTSAQKDSVKTILEDSRKEMAEAFKGLGKGGGGDGNREKFENLRKETTEKIQGVLTADQKKAWREMTGDTFKIERTGGGFGGGFFGKKGGDNKKSENKSDKKAPDIN